MFSPAPNVMLPAAHATAAGAATSVLADTLVPRFPYPLYPHVAIVLFAHMTAPLNGPAVMADGELQVPGSVTADGVVTVLLLRPSRLYQLVPPKPHVNTCVAVLAIEKP
jgi:hypothetical protein